MKWYIIDDCTTKKGAIYTEEIHGDPREALTAAWDALTEHDKAARDSFFAALCETDEDGSPIWWEAVETINL